MSHIELPDAETWSAEAVIAWGLENFGRDIAIASSFGVEDVALIDLASKISRDFRVFTLDTNFLFPETHELLSYVELRYGIKVELLTPKQTPLQQAQEHGEALWLQNPDRCCNLRKVEPLRAHLSTLQGWITGVRREQSPARANAKKISWDDAFGLVKLNPLADWTHQRVWGHIVAHRVPYNPLHDRGYASIGCTNCTRPIAPGEDPRAGRWSGFAKTECGLHVKSDVQKEASDGA